MRAVLPLWSLQHVRSQILEINALHVTLLNTRFFSSNRGGGEGGERRGGDGRAPSSPLPSPQLRSPHLRNGLPSTVLHNTADIITRATGRGASFPLPPSRGDDISGAVRNNAGESIAEGRGREGWRGEEGRGGEAAFLSFPFFPMPSLPLSSLLLPPLLSSSNSVAHFR